MGLEPSSKTVATKQGVVWDEQNLAENDRIKASLPKVKIDEPKTPWAELLPEDDIDLPPLSLDGNDHDSAPARTGAASGWAQKGPEPMVTNDDSSTRSKLMHLSGADIPMDPANRSSGTDGTPSSTLPPVNKFEQARKAHYSMKDELLNMKSALTSKLVSDEDDEDDEEEGTPP